MWIDLLLLARLVNGPQHGYELRKEVEVSTGRALSNNSLYPALRRFVDSGAVTRETDQSTKPPRHVYLITDVGRELFHDMLADFPEELALNDAEFLARFANFGWLRPAEQLRVLGVRDRAMAQERDRLAEFASRQSDYWTRRTLQTVSSRLETERAWLAEIRAEISTATTTREDEV